jgi:tetratricopeptide (TPR) repeat protein
MCLMAIGALAVSEHIRAQEDADRPGSSGAALSAIMNVRQAPVAKSMGLFQSSFLEHVGKNRSSMQLAVVIDTSESMSNELESIRKNVPNLMRDIYQLMDGGLEAALITYADIGASDNPATILSQGFVHDLESIDQIVAQIQPNTGRPYFPEAVDLGVYTALSKLNWSDQERVERWILVVGDAPPYDPDFQDQQTTAKRWYATDVLIDLANQRGIKIHCLLCHSRDEEKQAYVSLLDKTQDFMSRLSDGTGGLLLDLSYDHVREKLAENMQRPRTKFIRVGHITSHDIENARIADDDGVADANNGQPATEQRLRIAVLPFLPINSMSFLHSRPEVQLAAELRRGLDALPNLRTLSARQLESSISRLRNEGIPLDQLPHQLCLKLRLDFVIHGDLVSSRGTSSSVAQIYGRNSASPITKTTASGERSALGSILLNNIKNGPQDLVELRPLSRALAQLQFDPAGQLASLGIFAGLSVDDRERLLGAYEALEQATSYSMEDPKSKELLESVETTLNTLLANNRDHAFAQVLLSSCLYNQATALETIGQLDEARAKFQQAKSTITAAFAARAKLLDPLTRLEVEGDYQLLVKQDYPAAIEAYRKITEFSVDSPVRPALRAHWMLAGIFSGDWQIAKSDSAAAIMDPEKTRSHLVQILANWPESSEAEMVRRNMFWDDLENKTRSPYIPRVADAFSN